MNTMLQKLKAKSARKGFRNLAISIVILIEILAITTVSVFAWVETVSSIKIFGDGVIDTYVLTDAEIGSGTGIIDMGSYFKQSGNMHLAPASSADGKTMFFPKYDVATNGSTSVSTTYRKGNVSDKNTNYLSVTFRVKTDTNADFFFTKVPTFSALGSDVRISVTSRSEGSNEAPVTQIYANSKTSSSVVYTTSGSTKVVTPEAFADHVKGKSSSARLFDVAADETKVITINVWLQKKASDMSNKQDVTITDLGIVSSLTPRRVTLIPTDEWNPSGVTTHFYAWCWDATNKAPDQLFKLEKDENEHYSFDYNGTYQSVLFFRSSKSTLTTENMPSSWNKDNMWNKSENTSIPPSPVDPTFIITSISGGSYDGDIQGNKSIGEWVDPATIKLGYVNGQSSSCGTLSATSYIGDTTSTNVMETTSGEMHKDTVHAWPGKKIQLKASPKSNYQFVGWYTNPDGTGNAVSTNATYAPSAPTTATEITYYAKFNEITTITLKKYVDGSESSTAAGTISIDSTSGTGSSVSKTVEKGSSVKLSASANTGYTLDGIYNVASEGSKLSNPYTFTANTSATYYARFTTNEYNVTAHARHSTDGSSYSSSDTITGGDVRVSGDSTGSSSVTQSVKYKGNVKFVATAKSGYNFVGWYDGTGTSATQLSTSATYTYTLNTASDVNIYARFSKSGFYLTGYINGQDVTGTTNAFSGSGSSYTFTTKFTAGDAQYVTIWDGSKAYHPTYNDATSGAAASTTTDSTPAGPTGYKWKVAAPKGTTVTFTWNPNTRVLSWTIDSREIYFKPDSNWSGASARFAVYAFGSGSEWINMTSAGSGYYKATVPGKYPQVIFGRMDPDNSKNGFKNESGSGMWNQTGDQTIPANCNCCTIVNVNNGWDNPTTSWSLY